MVGSFPGIEPDRIGLYVGVLGSVFAVAQLVTNLGWGYLSDTHGRKPVLLMGMVFLGFCFAGFGMCTRYWHVLLVQILMGLTNGNAAVVPAVFGELTDRSNQTTAFKWLPVLYTIGTITGPGLGGFLVGLVAPGGYPYLLPNLICAGILITGAVVLGIWFEETRPASELLPLWKPACLVKASAWLRMWRLKRGRKRRRQSWSARWPRGDIDAHERRGLVPSGVYSNSEDDDEGSGDDVSISSSTKDTAGRRSHSRWQSITARSDLIHRLGDLLSPTTAVLLLTLFFFHMSMISFGSLFPTFAATPPPTGRGLSPGDIGGLLSASGIVTAVFQLFAYEPLKRRLGNLGSYRVSLLGFVVSMSLMPWVGYKNDRPFGGLGTGEAWLKAEMGVVLVIKNFAAVAGLASVMLLVSARQV
jgi:MFS family permease